MNLQRVPTGRSRERARVVIQGFGSMGREAVAALAHRSDAEIVAVFDTDRALVGRRLAEIVPGSRWPGVVVQDPTEEAIGRAAGDVALHATTAFAEEAVPQLAILLAADLDVVTLCQELVHPLPERAELAAVLDAIARRCGKSVAAGGVNPGWVLDLLAIAASLGCYDIRTVACQRIVDFSPYGPDEMAHIGAGLTEQQFQAGVRAGELGHVGLLESAHMVAEALGLTPESWTQTKAPLVSERPCATSFVTVEPGHVRGFRQRVQGRIADAVIVDFEMVGLLDPDGDDPGLGDSITIKAQPNVHLKVAGEIAQRGGIGTAGVATNLLGPVMAAQPGFIPLWRLPLERSRSQVRLSPGG